MKKERGFTIVELLIVIVVIGILAAIVLVAYNGVTNNAKDSNDKANATSLVKVAEALNAEKGWYPGGTSDTTTVNSTATLKTSFNAGTTSKLPSGLDITYFALNVTNPTYANVLSAADGTTRTYYVEVCTGTNGVSVYYPRRSDATLQSVSAGPGCV